MTEPLSSATEPIYIPVPPEDLHEVPLGELPREAPATNGQTHLTTAVAHSRLTTLPRYNPTPSPIKEHKVVFKVVEPSCYEKYCADTCKTLWQCCAFNFFCADPIIESDSETES